MRKTYKYTAIILVLSLVLSVMFSGCSMSAPEMKITVDGRDFKLDCKVSEILDAGFGIADIDHASHILASYPELDGTTGGGPGFPVSQCLERRAKE